MRILEYVSSNKNNINDIIFDIKQNNFECLSKYYLNEFSNIIVRCKNNHTFKTNLFHLKLTKFKCPICKKIDKTEFLTELKPIINKEITENVKDDFLKSFNSKFDELKAMTFFYDKKEIILNDFDMKAISNNVKDLIIQFLKTFERNDLTNKQIDYIVILLFNIILELYRLNDNVKNFKAFKINYLNIFIRKVTLRNIETIKDCFLCNSIYDFRNYFSDFELTNCSDFIIRAFQISIRNRPLIYYKIEKLIDNCNLIKFIPSVKYLFNILNDCDFAINNDYRCMTAKLFDIVTQNILTNAEFHRNFERLKQDFDKIIYPSLVETFKNYNKTDKIANWDENKLEIFDETNKKYTPFITSLILNISKKEYEQGIKIINERINKKDNALFNGKKFPLFAFDVSNFVNSLINLGKQDKNSLVDPFFKIKHYFDNKPYIAWFFAQKHLDYLEKIYPTNEFNNWYFEDMKKNGNQYVDIDATLTGVISSLLEKYHEQISKFYLGSGDKDLHVVVDMAKKFKIPTKIICISKENLSNELRNLADDSIILYK